MGLPTHLRGRLLLWPRGETTSTSPVSATPTASATVLLPGTLTACARLTMQDRLCTRSALGPSRPRLYTIQHLQCASVAR